MWIKYSETSIVHCTTKGLPQQIEGALSSSRVIRQVLTQNDVGRIAAVWTDDNLTISGKNLILETRHVVGQNSPQIPGVRNNGYNTCRIYLSDESLESLELRVMASH